MRTTLSMILLLAVAFVGAANAKTAGQTTALVPGDPGAPDDEEIATRKAMSAERAQFQPLLAQERAEIDAVKANKTASESAKKAAIKKIRKSYLDKRNAIRLQTRKSLKEKFLKAGAN